MTIRILSHPISHLTLTFLTTFTLTASTHAADPQTSAGKQSAVEFRVDPNFLSALLPPMSRLIPSPYSNPNSINNPLGVDQTASAKMAVIKTVPTHPETGKQKSIEESFRTGSESHKVRLPRAQDFTLSEPLSKSAQTGTPGTFRSLAVTD